MRAVRVSALRREFARQHGRLPRGCAIERQEALGKKGWKDLVKVARSRWRKMLVKVTAPPVGEAETPAVEAEPVVQNTVTEMFLRKIYGMVVVQPSEWRRLKKAYQRAKAAGTDQV